MADKGDAKLIEITVGETAIANVYGVPKDAKIVLERGVRAPMRDGVELDTNVYRPAAPGRYPVLLTLCPYGKDDFPAYPHYARIPNTGVIRVSEWVSFEAPDPVYWVPHGYIIIAADARGTHGSGGEGVQYLNDQQADDFHDLVEWAAKQPWCDGNVGANGVSYLAMTQWLGAAKRPPSLKAIMPWEGVTDPYREMVFNGGIPETGFFRRIGGQFKSLENNHDKSDDMVAAQSTHPFYDDYWKAKHPKLAQIECAAYICASWSTQGAHNRGTLEGYKQISSKHKWLQVHGRKEWETYYSREAIERQRRFFDHFLKGLPSGIEDLPRVRLEVRERAYEGHTIFADDFPVPNTEYRPLYLDMASRTLTTTAPAASANVSYAVSQAGGGGSAVFSHRFTEDADVVGYMKLRLWVSADGADDMDLHVGIKKFDRRGQEVFFPDFNHLEKGMVASGWLRVSHRELDSKRSTPWQPWHLHQRALPLQPGEIVPVEIEVLPSGTRFRAGETLQLIVQGHDTIQYMPRSQHAETVNRGHHVIHAGAAHDSHLLIPVLPKR